MFRYFRLLPPEPVDDAREQMTGPIRHLLRDAESVVPLRQLNQMPNGIKLRAVRSLIPPELMVAHHINPVTGEGRDKRTHVRVTAESGTDHLRVDLSLSADLWDPYFSIELQDTIAHGIQLNWLALNDPLSKRFHIDVDDGGENLYFGMLGRNLAEEERAMRGGLSPAQVRGNSGASLSVMQNIEMLVVTLSHTAYLLEPLTYTSAWLFERRGFAYVRGHRLMDEIHREFLPGGLLHLALDGSSPFRRPEQWNSVRGRAWAIHDGILAVMQGSWDNIRMIKRVGRHAGVDTMPGTVY